jgi:hypothetical protein
MRGRVMPVPFLKFIPAGEAGSGYRMLRLRIEREAGRRTGKIRTASRKEQVVACPCPARTRLKLMGTTNNGRGPWRRRRDMRRMCLCV